MRDSFLQLLNGERPAEVVWSPDLNYWIDGRCSSGRADPHLQTEIGFLELARELRTMPYFWYGKFWVAEPRYDSQIEILNRPDGNRRTITWRTPAGEISAEWTQLEGCWSEAPTRYAVQNERDLEVFLCLLEHRRLEPTNLDDFRQRIELWARYDGVPCIGLPRSPLPGFVADWAGVEHGALLALDYPDKVEEVLRLMTVQEQPVLEAVAELKPPLVHFPDNLSSDNLTTFFAGHMAERYRKRLEFLHGAGVRCAVHLDGMVRGLLPRLAAVGFDIVEALTPKPAGDVDVADVRTLAANDRVILWGGVPGPMFVPPFTWDDVKQHVETLLSAWGNSPFVLGVGDQVPPDGDLDFVRKISDLIRH
jgi:hypothetical protein